jgi:dihydrofolate synthase/folylpolyglutamate synthase
MQLEKLADGRTVLLDGAHNLGGVETFSETIRREFSGQKITLVMGMLQDKDWLPMCAMLAPLADRILLAPVHSDRSATPHGLAEACKQAHPGAAVLEFGSLREALDATHADPFIAITGSLYLVGEAMELLGLSAGLAVGERGLNEWGNRR